MSGVARKVTIVVEGGDLGAAFAVALGVNVGLASFGYSHRRDGNVQVWALAKADDTSARARWVRKCRENGLTVARAPWEQKREGSSDVGHA